MSRKYYEQFAALLRKQIDGCVHNDPELGTLVYTAKCIADIFDAAHDAFDRDRFLKACGLED